MISNIAPGIPNIPTNNAVPILRPIWNSNALPTKLIKNIINPPKIELATNLKIALNGIENTFPIIHSIAIHPKIIIAEEKSKFYHPTLFTNSYDKIWTNITYTTWFFLKYSSSIISKEIPILFAFFTKKSNLLLSAFIWYT